MPEVPSHRGHVRSIRDIPLTEEPHKSVLDALLRAVDESPNTGYVDLSGATQEQLQHLDQCPRCRALLGTDLNGVPGSGRVSDGGGISL